MTKSRNGFLPLPSPRTTYSRYWFKSPPFLHLGKTRDGWAGKDWKLLAAPGADQPPEAPRVRLCPSIPPSAPCSSSLQALSVDKLACRELSTKKASCAGGAVLCGNLSRTQITEEQFERPFNKQRFVLSAPQTNLPFT